MHILGPALVLTYVTYKFGCQGNYNIFCQHILILSFCLYSFIIIMFSFYILLFIFGVLLIGTIIL